MSDDNPFGKILSIEFNGQRFVPEVRDGEWLAGYNAAREQAAKVAEGAWPDTAGTGADDVCAEIAERIRAMTPPEQEGKG